MLKVSCVDSRGIHLSVGCGDRELFLYRFTADAPLPRPPILCDSSFTRFYLSPGTVGYSDTFLREGVRYYYRLADACEWVGEMVTAVAPNKKWVSGLWAGICTGDTGSSVNVVLGPFYGCPDGDHTLVITTVSQPIRIQCQGGRPYVADLHTHYDVRTGYLLVVYPVVLPPPPIPPLTATLSSPCLAPVTVPITTLGTCPTLSRLFPPLVIRGLEMFASSISAPMDSCCDLPKSPFPIYGLSFEVLRVEGYVSLVTIRGPTGATSTILLYPNGMVRYGYTSGIIRVGRRGRLVTAYVIVPALTNADGFTLSLQYAPVAHPTYLYPEEGVQVSAVGLRCPK